MKSQFFLKASGQYSFIALSAIIGLTTANHMAWGRSVSPFPETIANKDLFRNHNNTAYYFYVTGSNSGSIYGDGVYTDDSDISTAAVHAGVITIGQTAVVKVTALPGRSNYTASSKNGISSNAYSTWPGSYSIAADDGGDNSIIPAPQTMSAFKDYSGEVYLFSMTANKGAGSIWGSNIYTHDSYLEATAVHAGVLTDGAQGIVRVVMGSSRSAFLESYDAQRNFKSKAYGAYDGSYSISDVNGNTPLIAYPGSFQNPIEATSGFTLSNYKNNTGGSFYFVTTGANDGSVWGTSIYTHDSSLAAASLHAGALALNQTGVVKVTMLLGQSSYQASTANGITSKNYGAFDGSYSFSVPDGGLGNIPVVTSAASAIYASGQPFNYQITTTPAAKEYDATGLPKGLSINKSTGVISGFPQLTGRFAINLQASNSAGTSSKTLMLTIPGSISTQDCLFGYAELNYPTLFSGGTGLNEQFQGYVYRYYKNTNTYLGIFQGERIDILQPNVSNNIVNVGTVQQFKPITGCQ